MFKISQYDFWIFPQKLSWRIVNSYKQTYKSQKNAMWMILLYIKGFKETMKNNIYSLTWRRRGYLVNNGPVSIFLTPSLCLLLQKQVQSHSSKLSPNLIHQKTQSPKTAWWSLEDFPYHDEINGEKLLLHFTTSRYGMW